MKAITGYLLGAVLMAAVAGGFFMAGRLDQDMAHAEEHVATGEYDEPFQIYKGAERYYGYAGRLPWVGNGPLNDLRAREATLLYWQQGYAAVVPEVADPVANVPADNIGLQMVVANSMYREGLRQAKDKATTLGALDAAANAYASVLRNASRQDDAAYNYEFVAKLRTDVDKNKRKIQPPPSSRQEGTAGHVPAGPDTAKFKMYVPLDNKEINKLPSDAVKQSPIRKRG